MTSNWTELGDRCWVRRYPEWDLNIGVVAGSAGVLVVDTHATEAFATELLADVRRLVPGAEVRWAVNTHAHFDHTFGNSVFAAAGATVISHENAAAQLLERGPELQRRYAENPGVDPDFPAIPAEVIAQIATAPLVPADQTFSVAKVIDLGDRRVELLHLGNGHTDGDIVVLVPDADVVFMGDLIEESAPPSYGDDCYPLDWSDTVDRVVGLLTATTRVVPGHGAVVDAEFVRDQGAEIGSVANNISGLHHNGATLEYALRHDEWPYPAEHLAAAVRRGYEQLGGVRRTLPMA
ncbi:MBL fold metallo-hydrolase [Kribbella deserti]|uniref:MBL fold metallo-hydrolase n=1 Tax=Kribbella deserti TaxID=1926257 RepID=A0ABV6QDI7_9ACTN